MKRWKADGCWAPPRTVQKRRGDTPMAAEDVWIRQARRRVTRTRGLRLEAMMACVGLDEGVCGVQRRRRKRRESFVWS